MKALQTAIDLLFSDPNLALDGVWMAGGMPAVAIRVIRKAPDEVSAFGEARLWSETTRIDLRVCEVSSPRPGDRVVIEGETFEVQGEPIRDRERLVWTVDLRPA